MNTELRTLNYDIRHTKYDIRSSGYTLAEAMLAVVIVSMAASGVLLPFASGEAVRAEGQHRTLAAKLATDLIEQIVVLPFCDPNGSSYDYHYGLDAGDSTFDNIDDFDDYSEPQGQIRDARGAMFTDADVAYANFSRTVTCEYVRVPQQTDETLSATFILVNVKVYYRGQELVSISRLVSK